jgi:Zn-dependent M28 family amino/carboxypeptidase
LVESIESKRAVSSAITTLEAAALIQQAGLHPRWTIRVVFWTNEENGARGGNEYRAWAGDQVKNYVAAIEMDGGTETPVGFDLGPKTVPEDFRNRAVAIAGLLKSIAADRITAWIVETDLEPLMNSGLPAFPQRTTLAHYFDYHHSQADTFDKIVPEDFRECLAAMAVMSYVLADSQ